MRILDLVAALCGTTMLCACNADFITGGELVRPGEPTGTLRVVNGTSVMMDVIEISDCNQNTYGLNRLPQNTALAPGESFDFTVSAGCWDVDGGSTGVGDAPQRLDVQAGGIMEYTITD